MTNLTLAKLLKRQEAALNTTKDDKKPPKKVMKSMKRKKGKGKKHKKSSKKKEKATTKASQPKPCEEKKSNYGQMYYKNTNTIGIRDKIRAKNQVLSFGGKRCTLSQDALKAIGLQVVSMLDHGMNIADAKAAGQRAALPPE